MRSYQRIQVDPQNEMRLWRREVQNNVSKRNETLWGCNVWVLVLLSDREVKDPSSSSSSMNRRPLLLLTPTGVSCWMMCMSDVTEWDTPLQRGGGNGVMMRERNTEEETESAARVGMSTSLHHHHHTLWCPTPFPASQLALSSSPPNPSTSSPPFFSAAPDLCKPVSEMEHCRKKEEKVLKS